MSPRSSLKVKRRRGSYIADEMDGQRSPRPAPDSHSQIIMMQCQIYAAIGRKRCTSISSSRPDNGPDDYIIREVKQIVSMTDQGSHTTGGLMWGLSPEHPEIAEKVFCAWLVYSVMFYQAFRGRKVPFI